MPKPTSIEPTLRKKYEDLGPEILNDEIEKIEKIEKGKRKKVVVGENKEKKTLTF